MDEVDIYHDQEDVDDYRNHQQEKKMKLFKISQDKRFASIGETDQEAEWYTIEPHVERFVHSIPLGTEVGIKSEKKDNKNHLVFITKKNGTVKPQPDPSAGPSQQPAQKKPFTPGAKSPEVQESIKRQAIGNMTSRTMIALQGQVSPDNIKEVISDIYGHYQSLVG